MRDYIFGNFLQELRQRKGLTQLQLGSLVGVSDKAVSKWENGSAKPQSSLLPRLGEVLDISVDDLLSCQDPSFERDDRKGITQMKKELWDKASRVMHDLYGDHAPIECLNRFWNEYSEMERTDMILCFDLFSALSEEAKRRHEPIRFRGNGTAFVQYLLGGSNINPLPPHYRCPHCRTVIFDNSRGDGLDLPPKKCFCGSVFEMEGHDIPQETFRPHFAADVSSDFFETAGNMVRAYFKVRELPLREREHDIESLGKTITFTLSDEPSVCTLMLMERGEFERVGELARITGTAFDRIRVTEQEILRRFGECDTEGLPECGNTYFRDILNLLKPASFADLIRIFGLTHGTGVWTENAKPLIEQGIPLTRVITCRDDVFSHVREHLLKNGIADTGFAYKVMAYIRRRIYAREGIPDEDRAIFRAIGMEDWFVDSIEKIQMLFPKVECVSHALFEAKLMWYKVHYPAEFAEIMMEQA